MWPYYRSQTMTYSLNYCSKPNWLWFIEPGIQSLFTLHFAAIIIGSAISRNFVSTLDFCDQFLTSLRFIPLCWPIFQHLFHIFTLIAGKCQPNIWILFWTQLLHSAMLCLIVVYWIYHDWLSFYIALSHIPLFTKLSWLDNAKILIQNFMMAWRNKGIILTQGWECCELFFPVIWCFINSKPYSSLMMYSVFHIYLFVFYLIFITVYK